MKYYKILNEKEIHKNLRYHDGINIDKKAFSPYGSCESGGIYFSREDILSFLDHGPWIREVILLEDSKVHEDISSPKKWKADKISLGERKLIDFNVVSALIKEGANVNSNNGIPLQLAVLKGDIDIIRVILQSGADQRVGDYYALHLAAKKGVVAIVELLLKEEKDAGMRNKLWKRSLTENYALKRMRQP